MLLLLLLLLWTFPCFLCLFFKVGLGTLDLAVQSEGEW